MRHRPVIAVLVAVIALLLTVGGTAVAAQLITGKDVKNGSLTGKDVKDRSLTPQDFKGSVQGPTGATGATGPTGAQGSSGTPSTPGATGPAGLVAVQYVEGPTVTLPAMTQVGSSVLCPDGTSGVGGGARPMTIGPGLNVILDSSSPFDDADTDSVRDDGWAVKYNNPTNSASSFRVNAVCATVASVS